jgi:hypothetical protein
MTMSELARLWFNCPQQHAIIIKNIRRKNVGTRVVSKVTTR